MTISDPEYTEVKVKGVSVKKLLDPSFLGMMEQELDDANFITLIIASKKNNDVDDIISMSHPNQESEKENEIIITSQAKKNDNVKSIYNVLKKYFEKE